ncbi:MAG: hypothetical protein ACRD5D_06525, partial [Candidatus Polarisedimenticolia bacterium]
MKKVVTTLMLLLVVLAIGGGGFYVYHEFFRGAPPPAPAPVQVETPQVELTPPVLTDGPAAPAGAVATLVGVERSVKAKRSSELAWNDAETRMPLFENDAIRTGDKASAQIAFGENDLVDVDQNALVIIKARAGGAGSEEISLALLSGDLLDSLAGRPAPEQAEAIAKAAESRALTLRPAPGTPPGQKTRIAVKTLPDRSTTVAAVSGSLQVRTVAGTEITLKEKMVTRIDPKGLVATPRLLPGVPPLVFPENGATYAFQRKVPRVDMRWKPVERAKRYRVVVATDPAFRRILADDRVDGTTLPIRNLQPGTIYWRVRAQDGDGFEGAYSEVRKVVAVHDDAPPKLVLLSPREMSVAPAAHVELKGETDRGARVKVNGQKIEVGPDGSFSTTLALK